MGITEQTGAWVYSTKLKNNRFIVRCLLLNDKKLIGDVNFIVDTGAIYTCCSYIEIDEELQEKGFASSEYVLLGGFLKGDTIKFYKYEVEHFAVGNIDTGKQNLWITFDDRITHHVLGMDILRKVSYFSKSGSDTLTFFRDLGEAKSCLQNIC